MRPSQSSALADGKVAYAVGEVLTSWDHAIFTTIKSDDPETTGGQQIVLEPDYGDARVPAAYGRCLLSPLKELKPLHLDGAPCSFSFVNLSLYEHQDPLMREKYAGSFGLAIILALELNTTPDLGGRLGGPFRHALLAGEKRMDRQTLHLAALLLHDQLTASVVENPRQRRLDAALADLWNEGDRSRRKKILLNYVNSLCGLGELLPAETAAHAPTYLALSKPRMKRLYITYKRSQTFRSLLGYAAQVASILHSSSLGWTIVELNGSPKKTSPSDFREQALSVLFIPESNAEADQDDGVTLTVDELPRLDAERSREQTVALLFELLGVRFDTRYPNTVALDCGSLQAPVIDINQRAGDATVMSPKEAQSGATNKVHDPATFNDRSLPGSKSSKGSGKPHSSSQSPPGLSGQATIIGEVPAQLVSHPKPSEGSLTSRAGQSDQSLQLQRHDSSSTPNRDAQALAASIKTNVVMAAVPLLGDATQQPRGASLRTWLLPEGFAYHLVTIVLLITLILLWILKPTFVIRQSAGAAAGSTGPVSSSNKPKSEAPEVVVPVEHALAEPPPGKLTQANPLVSAETVNREKAAEELKKKIGKAGSGAPPAKTGGGAGRSPGRPVGPIGPTPAPQKAPEKQVGVKPEAPVRPPSAGGGIPPNGPFAEDPKPKQAPDDPKLQPPIY